MDLHYPPGPAAVPLDLTAPTSAYKRHAWLAMLGLFVGNLKRRLELPAIDSGAVQFAFARAALTASMSMRRAVPILQK